MVGLATRLNLRGVDRKITPFHFSVMHLSVTLGSAQGRGFDSRSGTDSDGTFIGGETITN